MTELLGLANLIRRRNALDHEIAALIGRPAHAGHVGEYIAAAIFDIALEPSAAHKGSDGRFAAGPLAGRRVNVKWYTHHAGLLDVNPRALPDNYLVLTGLAARSGGESGAGEKDVVRLPPRAQGGEMLDDLGTLALRQVADHFSPHGI